MSNAYSITGHSAAEDVFAFSCADNEVVLANIGDYGTENATETEVASMVEGWRPNAIFTNGDNSQSGNDYDDDVQSDYGNFVDRELLWPCPGNHDWDDGTLDAYLDYFTYLPNRPYYYAKVFGPVRIYFLDSNSVTPDGNTASSYQATWLTTSVANSRSPWNIAALHHPPYTSGATHSPATDLQWPFSTIGLDMVFSGHNHQYERLYLSGVYYIVNGLGGASTYSFDDAVTGSQYRYNTMNGAGKLIATPTKLKWEFYSKDNVLVDSVTLNK